MSVHSSDSGSDTQLANETWLRYAYMRDNGHIDFLRKAQRCENYFAGEQWDPEDKALLKEARRPALTINQILRTLSNVMGEQIFNRTETQVKPRAGLATEETASTLTKLFMQIDDNNQMRWQRSDLFADGLITSRGFYDIRMKFSDNLLGEVGIKHLNPKNVLLDPDSDSYDPKDWGDVINTKWLSPDEIETVFGKDKADALRARSDISFPYSYDSIDTIRDRFGGPNTFPSAFQGESQSNIVRNLRVIERQWKRLDRRKHFVDLQLGDTHPIPTEWDRDQIVAYLERNENQAVVEKLVQRVRWTIVADQLILYDDWSPYDEFTIVPFFPHFRRGKTIGLVENLLDAQELLNKATSQELHVINTSANSGWIVKDSALTTMSISELEQQGAKSGIVIEVRDINDIEKIQPNQVPTGLDRIAFKAEDAIKTISGVSDSQTGFAREDVAAKAIRANQQSGRANMAKVIDNLERTDFIAARIILNYIQRYYTDERVFRITSDQITGDTEELSINQMQSDGSLLNDLSIGEYDLVITSQPERDNFEETQFDQALSLRVDAGVEIPDEVLIQASKLTTKGDIIQRLRAREESPEAQKLKQIEIGMAEAELMKARAEAAKDMTDAQHNQAKVEAAIAQARSKNAAVIDTEDQSEFIIAQQQLVFEKDKFKQEHALDREKMERDFELKEDELRADVRIKAATARATLKLKPKTAGAK